MLDMQYALLATISEHMTFYSGNIAEFPKESYKRKQSADLTLLQYGERSCYPIEFEFLSSSTKSATSPINSVETGFLPRPGRTLKVPVS